MITDEQINSHFRDNRRAQVRVDAQELHENVAVHTRKASPDKLLRKFRPNELPQHLNYRLGSYEPLTFGYVFRVLQQLVKIRNAEDWRIEWPLAVANNPLKDYTQGNYPEHDTLENWLFNQHITPIVDDPMGAVATIPKDWKQILKTGTLPAAFQPVAYYFSSSEIQELSETLLVVNDTEDARDPEGRPIKVRVQYYFDADQMVRVVERKGRDANNPSEYVRTDYTHRLGYTVLFNGGFSQSGKSHVYDSFIGPAVPALNEFVQVRSDHKLNLALHINPDRWELAQKKCPKKCEGGLVDGPGGQKILCQTCQGMGKVARKSPFGVMTVATEKTGPGGLTSDVQPITPPAGYIERPTESIKIVHDLANGNIGEALAALNMEMLGGAGTNQSGLAKEYDQSNANGYLGYIASHLVENLLRPLYFFHALWLMPGVAEDLRKRYEPTINAQIRKFDLMTSDVLMNRVAAYKKDGANAAAQAEAEIKLAERQLGSDSMAYKQIRDTVSLDPLYSLTPEQKSDAKLNGGCSELDFVVSSQINFFVKLAAMQTKNGFYELDFEAKIAKIEELAQKVLDKQKAETPLLPEPGTPGNPAPQNNPAPAA